MNPVRRSLFYSMAGNYIGLPLQLIGTMVMSRLLTPEELGVFAVAAVFAYLASMIRDFGVAEYLIQERDLDTAKLRASLSVNIGISWFVGLVLFFGAPFAATFYKNAGVAEVMRVQAFNFALIPFGAVTMAYFRRELNFRPIFLAGLLSNIVTFVVSMYCAMRGMGFMSLAWSSLGGVIATVAVSVWFRPHDFPFWPGLKGIGEVFHFGKFASGVYIVAQLGRRAPEMIIGRAEGMVEVAIFSRGGGLVELFNRLVLQSILPICQPFFAKGQREDGSIARGYLQSVSYLTAVGWPALFFIAIAAYPAVMVLYGSQWGDSVILARILCAAAAAELVHYAAMEALLAVGEARRANNLQIVTQAARIAAILTIVPFGLVGACWMLIASSCAGALFAQHALCRAVGLRWRDVVASCTKSAAVTLAVALPLSLWHLYQTPNEHNYAQWLLVAVVLATLAWFAALRLLAHPFWLEIAAVVKSVAQRLRKQPEPLP